MKMHSDIVVVGNFSALMRNRGRIVPGSHREGHNIFTVTGRNLLSKLVAWHSLGGNDEPYTQRRIRWVGVGSGTQLEVPTVSSLNQSILVDANNYLAAIQAIEFPTSSSVRFIKEFSTSEITTTNTPFTISEAGMFADVSPAKPGNPNDGYEDVPYNAGFVDTVLNPASGTNPPVAYKAFEGLTKTVDFTFEIRWDFRFE